jgi:hypothetical protein
LRDKFISEDNTLDGKVGVPVVQKCLSLTIGFLFLESAHESMLSNLITPSLDILIYGLGILKNLHAYLQTVILDSL